MLEKFLNKKVIIYVAAYASAGTFKDIKGIVTNIDNDFIELDNNEVIAIKYITKIKAL